MRVITGTVRSGRVEIPQEVLSDGTQVAILAPDAPLPVQLSKAEEDELEGRRPGAPPWRIHRRRRIDCRAAVSKGTLRFRIKVSPRAAQQIREAADWWWENRPKAPETCANEVERGFDLICLLPSAGESVRHRRKGIRRLLLGRIRYYLYYKVVPEKEEVEVLALWHTSRGSKPIL